MHLTIRVTPNASADRIDGRGEDAAGRTFLKVRTRAIAENGKANKAVEQVLASALNLPRSAVRVVTGHKARIKRVSIDCTDGTVAAKQIGEWMNDDC